MPFESTGFQPFQLVPGNIMFLDTMLLTSSLEQLVICAVTVGISLL